ncbi:MAG: phage/plasmid replication protein [Melioribacteraceae bacterium]
MIDTIHITLYSKIKPKQEFFKNLKNDLKTDASTGEVIANWKGTWNNFKIYYYDNNRLQMQGSLAKYYFGGQNLYTLDRTLIKKAITKMSREIGLPIHEGVVTRLDLGDNFFVPNPVNEYTTFFGSLAYFPKSVIKNGETIYLGNNTRKIIFYDKIKEMNSKKVEYPKTFKGRGTSNSQILRYEVRILKVKKCSDIKEILKKNDSPAFLVELLYEKEFYNSLVDIWLDYFERIPKINTIVANTTKLNSVNSLREYLAYLGLLGLSYDFVLNAIEARRDGITNKQYFDMKKELNRIAQNSFVSEIDPRIKTLTDKIRLSASRQKNIDRWTKELEMTYFISEV